VPTKKLAGINSNWPLKNPGLLRPDPHNEMP